MRPEEILRVLAETANSNIGLAIFWHLYIGAWALVWLLGSRIPSRLLGLAITPLLLSVSILAWQYDSPFNGAVFLITALLSFALAMRLPAVSPRIASLPRAALGMAMFVFGWIYPHFLENASPVAYLYASPLGLIPCPTLAAVIGIGLAFSEYQSRAWLFFYGAIGLFYGLFGALRLGVVIDIALAVGALILLTDAIARAPETRREMIRKTGTV